MTTTDSPSPGYHEELVATILARPLKASDLIRASVYLEANENQAPDIVQMLANAPLDELKAVNILVLDLLINRASALLRKLITAQYMEQLTAGEVQK